MNCLIRGPQDLWRTLQINAPDNGSHVLALAQREKGKMEKWERLGLGERPRKIVMQVRRTSLRATQSDNRLYYTEFIGPIQCFRVGYVRYGAV